MVFCYCSPSETRSKNKVFILIHHQFYQSRVTGSSRKSRLTNGNPLTGLKLKMNKTKHASPTIFHISLVMVTPHFQSLRPKTLDHLCPFLSPLHLIHQNSMSAPPSKQVRIQSLSPTPLLLRWPHHPYSWNSLYSKQPLHWSPCFPRPPTVCSPKRGQNEPLKCKSQLPLLSPQVSDQMSP